MNALSESLKIIVSILKNDKMFSDISENVVRKEFRSSLKACKMKIIAAVMDNEEFSSGNRGLTSDEMEVMDLAEIIIDNVFDTNFVSEIAINMEGEELEEDGYLEEAIYKSLLTLRNING